MAAFVRRGAASGLGGIAIWLLSFPLVASSRPAAPLPPPVAAFVAFRDADEGFHPSHHLVADAPVVVLGELVAPAPAPEAPAAPVPVPAAPVIEANWISIPRLGLSQPVGWYTDCLGRSPVPRAGSWRWNCAGANNTYIMAHNPGVFTPILQLHAGDTVQYGDAGGRAHRYRVTSTTIVNNTELWPLGGTAAASLTLQTCWTWDGSRDFIVRAVEI